MPAAARFHEIFRRSPTVLTRAPGRINLIGEHVDYQGGLVLPAAIDRRIFAAAAPIPENELRLWTPLREGQPLTLSLENPTPLTGSEHWANYILGVVATYREAGHPICGFEAAFTSDLPIGAGLSSSAALESAVALIVESLTNNRLAPLERALLCQRAESTFAGVPCGIMDPLAVNAGIGRHALLLDCRSLEWSPVAIPQHLAFVIINSGVTHSLADGEYAQRRADCETAARTLGVPVLRDATPADLESGRVQLGEKLHRRARHVVTEIARVTEFVGALTSGDSMRAGELMSSSHASLRDDFEVSCTELDSLVEIAILHGALGARMVGGGFGGSALALVTREKATRLAEETARSYRESFGKVVTPIEAKVVSGATVTLF